MQGGLSALPIGTILPFPLEVILIAALGLILGSFATALSYRGQRGIAWYGCGDRSFCPHCHHVLSILDLLPLLSWLFLRGRCRHCRAHISRFYPLTETVLMALCLLYYFVYGLSDPGAVVPIFFALPFLWALVVIDLRTKTLPDDLVLAVLILGGFRLVSTAFAHETLLAPLFSAMAGAVVFGGISWAAGMLVSKVTGKAALGFGDVKFFAVAGLWLGLSFLAWFCIIAGVSGLVLGVIWRWLTGEERFPFGPALIFSFCSILAFGGSLSP
ncbi:MAG: prepilin peptidase [Alphaproteobacteria bacterium]|nr:prepilin peptidase [Alphaproteobacteria bacterium]